MYKNIRRNNFSGAKIKATLKESVIFDGRNQYSISTMKDLGIEYYCIGLNI